MKKLYGWLMIVCCSFGIVEVASAQIWSETFGTNTVLENVSVAQTTNVYPRMVWSAHRVGNRATLSTNGLFLRVSDWGGQQGYTEGASIALEDSLFTTAGTYRVTVDIRSIQADGFLGVGVWDADIGSGGTNNHYNLLNNIYWRGTNSPCKVTVTGDATANLLNQVIFDASHKGIRSFDFTYDGSGDLVVQLSAISETASANRNCEIYGVSVDGATPNSSVPSFTSPDNTITPTAVQDVAYSNNTFVTGVTTFSGGPETLYYSARMNGAPGLSIDADGTIYGTPTLGGTNTMLISVADADGAYDEASFSLYVDDVNDAPTWPGSYGSNNNFWAGNALVGQPYSANLNGYAVDPEGTEMTFSGTGPSWLTIDSGGDFYGMPGTNDYSNNEWEIIASDGELSSTGTLHIAVEWRTIVHQENFSSNAPPNWLGAHPVNFPFVGQITSTQTNGFWYGGGWYASVNANNQWLQFARPNETAAGTAGSAIVFDEALFVDGAGTYQVRYSVSSPTGGGTPVYTEVYDCDFIGGDISVPNYKYGSPGIMQPITATNGATATLLTSITNGAIGNRTIDFDYDGSGDVLVRIGAGKDNADWWVYGIDDFKVMGPSQISPLMAYCAPYGLKGADAAATLDYEGDGWDNLFEYGLGLDPTTTNVVDGAYPTVTLGASGLVYVHAQRTDDPTLTYSVETNPDLANPGGWTASGISASTNVTAGTYDYVTNTIPTTDPARFLKLQIAE